MGMQKRDGWDSILNSSIISLSLSLRSCISKHKIQYNTVYCTNLLLIYKEKVKLMILNIKIKSASFVVEKEILWRLPKELFIDGNQLYLIKIINLC
jgi:hypothetical protein